ncbi:hypothetical protein [Streptomyces sp.]|uniref:hypothetical protein n=1 Tax=Streptomyces sp. TaxID=1931 RepID=UPI002D78F0E2|nr:hypothetical protein [Streptomyces sp.]HET6358810.1 hypothetical protein [Streptomyces sp.]
MTTKRVLAAGATVVVSALVNLTVGMLTQKWNWAWLACSIVLIVLGVALQMWLTKTDGSPHRSQVFKDVEGKSLQQKMKGAGDQRVTRAKVEGHLGQTQDD